MQPRRGTFEVRRGDKVFVSLQVRTAAVCGVPALRWACLALDLQPVQLQLRAAAALRGIAMGRFER